MYRPSDVWRLLSLAVLIGAFACTDLPTATEPVIETGEATPFFLRAPAPGMEVLHKRRSRNTGDTGDTAIIVSKKMGPKGGVIQLRELGVRIYFPRDALSRKTEITVKAFGGSAVAFEFGPHGLTFNVPVEIRIAKDSPLLVNFEGGFDDYDGGESGFTIDGLVGVYFLGNPATGVIPLETIPIYLDGDELVFEIWHFSGYAVASA